MSDEERGGGVAGTNISGVAEANICSLARANLIAFFLANLALLLFCIASDCLIEPRINLAHSGSSVERL